MSGASDINQPIVEALYCDALVLADEVRAAFDLGRLQDNGMQADLARVALSSEGLRTTTRMMHILAWLLNHRAFFSGELSEFQLRRHGMLPPDRPADPEELAALEPATRELVAETERLHQRIARLDKAWRERFETRPAAILRLRKRLDRAVARI
jgi:regulator of CtrA degradation